MSSSLKCGTIDFMFDAYNVELWLYVRTTTFEFEFIMWNY